MKRNVSMLLLFVYISVTSCDYDKSETVDLPFVNLFGIDDYERAQKELGVYVDFGTYTDAVIELRHYKSILTEGTMGYLLVNYVPEPNSGSSDGGRVLFNDLETNYNFDKGGYEIAGFENQKDPFILGELLKKYTGKEASFVWERDGKTLVNQKIYIPETISVTGFTSSGRIEGTAYHGLDRGNFTFNWNADPLNDNGILAVLTWSGDMISDGLGELVGSPKDYHYKAALMEDNGGNSIPSEFFKEVPKGAIFNISFFRGNFRVVRAPDSRNYKLYSISNDQITFVMEN